MKRTVLLLLLLVVVSACSENIAGKAIGDQLPTLELPLAPVSIAEAEGGATGSADSADVVPDTVPDVVPDTVPDVVPDDVSLSSADSPRPSPFCVFALGGDLGDLCHQGVLGTVGSDVIPPSGDVALLLFDDAGRNSKITGYLDRVVSYGPASVAAITSADLVNDGFDVDVAVADVVNRIRARILGPSDTTVTHVLLKYGYYSADEQGNRVWSRFDWAVAPDAAALTGSDEWYVLPVRSDVVASYDITIGSTQQDIPISAEDVPENVHVLAFACTCDPSSCADQSTWACNPQYDGGMYGDGSNDGVNSDYRYVMGMVNRVVPEREGDVPGR
jgi:hypothetical protein